MAGATKRSRKDLKMILEKKEGQEETHSARRAVKTEKKTRRRRSARLLFSDQKRESSLTLCWRARCESG